MYKDMSNHGVETAKTSAVEFLGQLLVVVWSLKYMRDGQVQGRHSIFPWIITAPLRYKPPWIDKTRHEAVDSEKSGTTMYTLAGPLPLRPTDVHEDSRRPSVLLCLDSLHGGAPPGERKDGCHGRRSHAAHKSNGNKGERGMADNGQGTMNMYSTTAAFIATVKRLNCPLGVWERDPWPRQGGRRFAEMRVGSEQMSRLRLKLKSTSYKRERDAGLQVARGFLVGG